MCFFFLSLCVSLEGAKYLFRKEKYTQYFKFVFFENLCFL
jgi:hypothetical protein